MTGWEIAQWILVAIACAGLLTWVAWIGYHLHRALRCDWSITGPADLVEQARKAAFAAVDAGVSRVAVYRGVNDVEIEVSLGRLGNGAMALHHGHKIEVTGWTIRVQNRRIVYWETLVNGIGRKMWRLRGYDEKERESYMRELGAL